MNFKILVVYLAQPKSSSTVKLPLKNRQNKGLNENGSLMKVKGIAECSKRAFCNTLDLHEAITGLESQFLVFF